MLMITLAAARVNVGLTQKEAADALNISHKTLCSWENGKTFPPADKLREICALYNVPIDALNFLPSDSL